jgi:quercetin dioxygenase-like cupin family protein
MVYQATEEVVAIDPQVAEVATSVSSKQAIELQKIEVLERSLLDAPQADFPLEHAFAPNVYIRQITMPKDTIVIGHQHKTEHFNIVLSGKASVYFEGQMHEIVAPCIFKSSANVRKVLFIHETMVWATVHPTSETNLDKLDEELVIKSESFKQYEIDIAKAKELMNNQKETL